MIFSTCCAPKPEPTQTIKEQRLADPGLLYFSSLWGGLCSNEAGESGGCYTEMYLFGSGKFFKESGFLRYGGDDDINPTIERDFTPSIVGQITNKIKDSGVMGKDCPSSTIMDAGWDYQVNIDGVKKLFSNPLSDCRDIFDEVDNLIDAILNYRE